MPIWPTDTRQRESLRQEARKKYLAEAERKALAHGASIKCGDWGRHAHHDAGCASTGTTCLCSCHDRAMTPVLDETRLRPAAVKPVSSG